MSEHYEVFYCLEQQIRRLVAETLEDAVGANWWDTQAVPDDVKQNVADGMKREQDGAVTARSEKPIDYTTFGELGKLIEANWINFEPILRSKNAVKKIMTGLNLLRNPIAHCCPLQEDEIARLRLAVRDWFRLFG